MEIFRLSLSGMEECFFCDFVPVEMPSMRVYTAGHGVERDAFTARKEGEWERSIGGKGVYDT